jgi:sporulation protein YlmC with PRC-barrel domain
MYSFSDMEMKNFFGKRTRDIYGRNLGEVVAMLKNSDGELEYLQVNQNEGRLVKYSAEQIMTDENEIVIVPTWKIQAEKIRKELEQIKKRKNALEAMLEKEEVSKKIFEGLKLSQSSTTRSLKEKNYALIDDLKKRLKALEGRISELTNFLIEMRTGKMAGEILNNEYQKAQKSIEQNLNCIFLEKQDIENILADLNSEI